MEIINFSLLKQLDYFKKISFSYLTCERLLPNYVFFSKKYQFGDSDELKIGINYLYENMFSYAPNQSYVDLLIQRIEVNIPEPANYDTILASSSLDACNAIIESLDFLIDKEESRLISISTMATDTVDMYIQEVEDLDYNNDELFQKKIDDHHLMQNEIKIQNGIISYLNKIDKLVPEDIKILVEMQGNINGNLSLFGY